MKGGHREVGVAVVPSRARAVQQNTTPEAMISQAMDKGMTVDVIERLVALKERMDTAAAKRAYMQAMADFQAECPIIKKLKAVKNKKKDGEQEASERYRYAPYDYIISQVRDLMQKHGLSHDFDMVEEGDKLKVICNAHHVGGYSESNSFTVERDPDAFMNKPQKTGAATTFAKRYAFCNKFGITVGGEDTDANTDDEKMVSEEGFKIALGGIAKFSRMQCEQWRLKFKNSPKYTDEQKEQLYATIDAHVDELKKANAKQ